ncbi:MAG: chemotaxis protein CheB [Gammaproteobacteria bacterium]
MMASSSKSNVASFVVGIGASAGGLEALEEFFKALPADSGMAFVVVQHLNPDFKSLMDELLDRHTDMIIHKIEEGMIIEPNSIYLIPANKMMTLNHDRFELTERDDAEGLNLPIDRFFISLSEQRGESSVGIILSGTGSDGTRGVRAIHQAGGLVLAQTVDSSRFDGMPRSAVATGIVDAVLVPSAMPRVLIDYAGHGRPLTDNDENALELPGIGVEPFRRIIDMLGQHFGVDFGLYKRGTISRRIERRMALHSALTIDDYVKVVEEVPDEIGSLYRDLLIGVTEFFRDESAWDELKKNVIPKICDNAKTREVRCWVAGTASGEEAYTLAILCHEYLSANNIPLNVRIFATDLHTESLDFAGQGIYSSSSLARISSRRVGQYFASVGPDRFQVRSEIRSMVVFAKQDLTNDPPFTNMDLVTCRNVIIYFDVEAQLNALSLFHFSLRVGGTLFLGPSESLTELAHEFDVINEKARLYSKRRDIRLPRRMMASRLRPRVDRAEGTSTEALPPPRQGGGRDVAMLRAYDTILDKYAPTSLLVDSFGQLAHTFNRGSDYLRPSDGVATLDILDLIHADLRMALSTGLQRARREPSSVRYGGIRVHVAEDDVRIVRVMVDTLDDRTPADYYLVTLEEAHRTVATVESDEALPETTTAEILPFEAAPFENSSAYSDHVSNLEQELRYTKEYLQATNEELETSNEELQATNEELMASNEELQSTNEELQSVNEELYSVNKEYELKIDELTVMTDDMNNLLVSTDIGTVFLDDELCIRRFTPAVGRHFSLMHHDIGRPIAHINTNFSFPGLLRELRDVLNTGDHREYEVQDESDNWFLMTLLPYRLKSGKIDGVVLSFVDITNVRRTAAQLARAGQEMQGFSYAVSHELLSPLRDISNSAQLLEEESFSDMAVTGRDYLSTIRLRADRIREMIGGLLQFSRVMTRGQPFAEIDFYDVVSDARAAVKVVIDKSNATIDTRLLPNVLRADREQLVQLVSEVFTNAIRFNDSETPEITLSADLTEDQWRINFTDNGPGINGRDRERIFDMFARGADLDPSIEGFGIGLAVARRIAERHGGWLSCEPHTDGAKFVFTMPVSAQEAE